MALDSTRWERPRILLRELKRTRRPRKWESLPCLRLCPESRALYICRRCTSPNVLGTCCPWCSYECQAMTLVRVVRRRVTSPALLTDAQKAQLERIARRTRTASMSPSPSHPRDPPRSAGRTSGRAQKRDGDGTGAVPDRCLEAACEIDDGDIVRRRRRKAALHSATDVVATATVDASLQPFLDLLVAAHWESTTTTESTPPSPQYVRTPPRRPAASFTHAMSTSAARHRGAPPPHDPSSGAPSPSPSRSASPSQPSLTGPSPSLRRKRRMSLLRQRSSCSLRRRAASSSPTSGHRRNEAAQSALSLSARSRSRSRVRFGGSSSPTPDEAANIPLGHPQRPLYTMIRKDMFRPGSPEGASYAPERGVRSLDLPRFGSVGRAAYAYAPRPPLQSGFSVSGETELRMDLAKSRSMDGAPSDFVYVEMKRERGGERDGMAAVKSKVKSLGKSLKGLIRGRS